VRCLVNKEIGGSLKVIPRLRQCPHHLLAGEADTHQCKNLFFRWGLGDSRALVFLSHHSRLPHPGALCSWDNRGCRRRAGGNEGKDVRGAEVPQPHWEPPPLH